MGFFSNKTRSAVLAIPGKLSVPERHPVEIPVQESKEFVPPDYNQLAQRLGFSGIAGTANHIARTLEFEKFLHSEGICIYDKDRVRTYLRKLCPKDKVVVWVSLSRQRALDEYFDWSKYGTIPGPYQKPIPMAVLLVAERIKQRFPEAEFFASDFTNTVDEDPFLAVMVQSKIYIIERWDEPGFRM